MDSESRALAEQLLVGLDIEWKKPPGDDSTSADELWTSYPRSWVVEAEFQFQRWVLETGGPDSTLEEGAPDSAKTSKLRRSRIGHDQKSGRPLPWTDGVAFSADFLLMTCMEQRSGETRGRVRPLRRCEDGVQTHPPRGKPHPWYLKKVSERDSSDWLNNSFFFQAFSQAMGEAGHRVEGSADDMFDFRYNQDFRGRAQADSRVRGGVMYIEPAGWKKFAVRVFGRYDQGKNTWLCLDGRPGEWAVAYHGTNFAAMPGILSDGLRAGERQAYKDHKDVRTGRTIGSGIYCTPQIETAAEYCPQVHVAGRALKFVFQCRVRPEAIQRIHEEVGRESGAYWLINDPSDIRPYGVVVHEDA